MDNSKRRKISGKQAGRGRPICKLNIKDSKECVCICRDSKNERERERWANVTMSSIRVHYSQLHKTPIQRIGALRSFAFEL